MTFTDEKPLTVRNWIVGCVLFWTVFCLMIAGCAKFSPIRQATKEYVDSLSSSSGSHLSKKVAMVRFENKTMLKITGSEEKFLNYLSNTMQKECSEVLLLKPGETAYPKELTDLAIQPSGEIDNLYLAETGRQFGLNAIITGAIINISDDREKHGMLWFKNTRIYIRVQIEAAVYDTVTGAKLLDNTFDHRVELDDLDVDFLDEYEFKLSKLDNKTMDKILSESFEEISSEMGEAVCEALEDNPWRGFVISVDNNKIVLSSGKAIGLKAGDTLEVYNASNIYQGAQDQRFFVPGKKTGEIKITSVSADMSIAELVSGKDIKPDSLVIPKK